MNRKGVILPIIVFAGLTLVVIYIILFLPIPAFARIRQTINYFSILIFWVLFQALLIFLYYKGAIYARRGYKIYQKYIARAGLRIQNSTREIWENIIVYARVVKKFIILIKNFRKNVINAKKDRKNSFL